MQKENDDVKKPSYEEYLEEQEAENDDELRHEIDEEAHAEQELDDEIAEEINKERERKK